MKLFLLILLLTPLVVLANPGAKVDIDRHPSNNEVFVKVDQNEVVRVKIFTATDQLIWSEERYDAEFKLDFTYFPAGLYDIQIVVNGKMERFEFRKD